MKNRYDDTISFVYEQKLQLFYMTKNQFNNLSPTTKEKMHCHTCYTTYFILFEINKFFLS